MGSHIGEALAYSRKEVKVGVRRASPLAPAVHCNNQDLLKMRVIIGEASSS